MRINCLGLKRRKVISMSLRRALHWLKGLQSAIIHIDTATLRMTGNQSAERIFVILEPGDYPVATFDDLINTVVTIIIPLF